MDHIAGIKDNTYSRGQIGVAAEDDTGTPTQVVYDHAMVWQL
jgi:hypothetical protein